MEPSQPGYSFRSADIIDPSRSNTILTDNALRQVVAQTGVSNGITEQNEGAPAMSGLIAAMTLAMRDLAPASCRFNVYPIVLPISDNGGRQQVLPQNLNRKWLEVSYPFSIPSTAVTVLFEEGPTALQLFASESESRFYITRGITINSYFEPFVPPTNAITLAQGNSPELTYVLVIEGV